MLPITTVSPAVGVPEKVTVPVPAEVNVSVFEPLTTVIVEADSSGAVKVPRLWLAVAFVVSVIVFEPLVIEIEVPVNGGAEKVPVAFEVVPLLLRTRALEPLVTETVVPAAGVPAAVPTTFAFVPPLASVSVLEPLVTVAVVPANGVPAVVPMTFAPVPLVVKLRVFAPLTTVIALVDRGGVEKVPVWDAAVDRLAVRTSVPPIVAVWPFVGLPVKVPVAVAAVGGLASKVTPSTVNVELPEMVPELSEPTVLVFVAAMPPTPTLQSFSRDASLPRTGSIGRRGAGGAPIGRAARLSLACCIL